MAIKEEGAVGRQNIFTFQDCIQKEQGRTFGRVRSIENAAKCDGAEMQIPACPSSATAGGTEAPRVTRRDSQEMQAQHNKSKVINLYRSGSEVSIQPWGVHCEHLVPPRYVSLPSNQSTFTSITPLSPSLALICVVAFVLFSGCYKSSGDERHIRVCAMRSQRAGNFTMLPP